jgi:hypothetical protein
MCEILGNTHETYEKAYKHNKVQSGYRRYYTFDNISCS